MSTSAVDGLVSGLQTSALVSQLMQLEAQPRQQLQVRINENSAYVRALQSVSSVLKRLDDAASALTVGTAKWGATTATVSGDAVTAVSQSGAAPTSFDVTVDQLATARTWTSTSTFGMDDAVIPAGTLQVTDSTGAARSLQPASGSLRDVMSAVNGAEGLGLRAVAVRVSDSGYRLQIVSTDTGSAAQQRIDPAALTGGMTEAGGTDARYSVGGVPGVSASNSVTAMVSGVDVTLRRTGTATVAVAADTTTTVTAVKNLVGVANDVINEVKRQTATDPAGARGTLASDSMVRALSTRVQQAFSDALGGVNAAAIGIQTTREGGLVLDEAKLSAAVANDPDLVRDLVAPTDGSAGIGARLRTVVASATGTDGFLASAIQGRESSTKSLQTQMESWDRRLELRKATLERQFTALEVSLGKLQSQSTWLSGQLNGLYASMGSAS